MATKQFSRRQKALAVVPLALVSGVWTASLAGTSAVAAGDKVNDDHLPDGTSVPSQAIEAPANLPSAGLIAPGVASGAADKVVDTATTGGIPSAALSAYQRAAQIIDSADKTCNVPWELIAAIGRVESDHGRYDGNVLSAKGVSQPGIYGIELDGKNGTQAVRDTDDGSLDKDKTWDRAMGAMQFIPSTWQVVKVDADGDGQRNPQDIDDASLATAVYLCSGDDDLAKTAGQKKAVYRYNHSTQYVDLVLRLMRAYMAGDYTAVPNDASGGQVLSSGDTTSQFSAIRKQAQAKQRRQQRSAGATLGGTSGGGSGGGGTTGPGSSGSAPAGAGDGTGSLPGSGSGSSSSGPGQAVTDRIKSSASGTGKTLKDTTSGTTKTVTNLVDNIAEGARICRASKSGLTTAQANACGAKLVGKTVADAQRDVAGVLSGLLDGLGGILGG